ncbi:MAG TPA: hypothetical protein VNR51_09765 [Hyphomicrobium sp.]|nr:hypothetical protein [Hyphomicrobium sp.]
MKTSRKGNAESLEARLAQATLERDTFRAELAKLQEARLKLVRAGSSAELDANDAAQQIAQRGAERAAEFIAVLDADLQKARADAALARQAEAEERANAAAQDAADGLAALWNEFVPRLRHVLRAAARADALVEEANRGRSRGEPVAGVEARARTRPALPLRVLSERVVERWVFDETGAMLDEQTAGRVKKTGASTGRLEHRGRSSQPPAHVTLRKYVERVYLPAKSSTAPHRPLPQEIRIPGLRAGDTPGWCEPPDRDVAAWVDHLEDADARGGDDREPVTELTPVEQE